MAFNVKDRLTRQSNAIDTIIDAMQQNVSWDDELASPTLDAEESSQITDALNRIRHALQDLDSLLPEPDECD